MDKAFDMGRTSVLGSFHSWLGIVISTVILAVGTILLSRLMLPSEYGLYSVALIPSVTLNLFRDWGMSAAITKYVASYKAENNTETVRRVIASGVVFELATGFILTVVSLIFAESIASTFLHRPESANLIAIASLSIFAGSLLTAAQSAFVGFERMKLNSMVMIVQSVVKSFLAPVLVFLGYSALGAVLGYSLSVLAAGAVGLGMLYFGLYTRLRGGTRTESNLLETTKFMLRYGTPLFGAALIAGFLPQFYSFMMAIYAGDAVIGNYSVAATFAVLLTFFTFPIGTVLLPAFAKIGTKSERELLKTVFQSSVKYSTFLIVPAAMAVMVLSGPLVFTLFGGVYDAAPFFLSLSITGFLFVGLGSMSVEVFLPSVGETKTVMKLNMLKLLIGLPLSFVLIPALGVVGVIAVTLVGNVPTVTWGLWWVSRNYGAKVDWKSSSKIFVSSAVAAIITYLITTIFVGPAWIELLVGGVAFVSLYLIVTPLTGAINLIDTNNLRTISMGLGYASKLALIPLDIIEKVLNIRLRESKDGPKHTSVKIDA